jgi:hypothetical protein
MADEMEILVFEISGEAHYAWTPPPSGKNGTTPDLPKAEANSGSRGARTPKSPPPDKPGDEEPSVSKKQIEKQIEMDYINILNTKAEDIADDIQGELRKYLMHGFKIQAEIGFSRGSIILSGTIILIGWAGPVIADAARKELSEIVRVAVRRVIGRYFSEDNVQFGPMEITVQERRAPQYVPPRQAA